MNHNAGAESTIHALLSMIALDAHPDGRPSWRRPRRSSERVGHATVQAETGTLAGGAHAVALPVGWTGESQYGGTGYVALLGDGAAARSPSAQGWGAAGAWRW